MRIPLEDPHLGLIQTGLTILLGFATDLVVAYSGG